MRLPGDITRTDNVYRATRAALLSIHHHNHASERVICWDEAERRVGR